MSDVARNKAVNAWIAIYGDRPAREFYHPEFVPESSTGRKGA